ncbi:MAG: hypothetical protein JWQ04_3345 [Pedosphaera sp.]|nr:hypothetical protein [Pedosphaera sp.]
MGKMRSDSKWNDLTEEQRDTLEGWLFEEHLSYRETLERLEKDFSITATMTSLSRYYQHLASKRMQAELLEVNKLAVDVADAPVDPEGLSTAAIMLVTKRMIQLAVEKPGNVKDLASLARIVVASDAVEVKKIWVQLAEDRRHDELMEQAVKAANAKAGKRQFQALMKQLDAENATSHGQTAPPREATPAANGSHP